MPPKVKIQRSGLRELLNSSMVAAYLLQTADQIKAVAEATAPTGVGQYKTSFSTEARRRMGAAKDRTGAVVINDAAHARFVEYGGQDTPARHTLLRAATSVRVP
ncbi:HK97 gp10 family phage protein [Streptomyces sp. QH1-20]|uniref:HK97 gp10 family phage protein n=1 Tax=Streptomyces sp. QH1-20 TaxID=3240934 RepID=UPI0035128DCA